MRITKRLTGRPAALLMALSDVGNMRLRAAVRFVLRVAWFAALGAVPVLIELDRMRDRWTLPGTARYVDLIWVWAAAFAVTVLIERAKEGVEVFRWNDFWSERATVLTGSIGQLCEMVRYRRNSGRRKPEPSRIASSLLQQLTDVIEGLTRPGKGNKITSCLLVPERDGRAAGSKVVALVAFTYNHLTDRRYSRVPIDRPGAAGPAFCEKEPVVVSDTTVPPYAEEFKGRPYKSVIGFPVLVGGEVLAVVTVDATEAGFFTQELMERKLLADSIAPYLKLIALLRLIETKGGDHGN